MKLTENMLRLSAGDLSNYMACKHLTTLDQAGALGNLEIPIRRDPSIAAMQQRGLELEKRYLAKYKDQALSISEPGDEEEKGSLERTINAMKKGSEIIYQATLKLNQWHGRADFLTKVNRPSLLGDWSYEVVDSKLAMQTRVGTIVQLCLYSEMVADIQGLMPEYMHVITPSESENQVSYRIDDFAAYYRFLKKQITVATGIYAGPDSTYPIPCAYCDICKWWDRCNSRLRSDDHLSFVAGLGNIHINELSRHRVTTMQALSQLPVPIPFKPERGAVETYERLRDQANVQVRTRESGKPIFELITLLEVRGFFRMPTPSPGDIFFDFEGD